jgi:hypothetical protein
MERKESATQKEFLTEIGFDGDPVAKQKVSFSISKLSQFYTKKCSEEFRVTQGHVVELAPILFKALALKSMQRRAQALPTLRILQEQIKRSFKALAEVAPHLSPYVNEVTEAIAEVIDAEEAGINSGIYEGTDFLDVLRMGPSMNHHVPPYYQEIREFIGEFKELGTILSVLEAHDLSKRSNLFYAEPRFRNDEQCEEQAQVDKTGE